MTYLSYGQAMKGARIRARMKRADARTTGVEPDPDGGLWAGVGGTPGRTINNTLIHAVTRERDYT